MPQQILIEAKILEITLSDSNAYGINWTKVFNGGETTIGVQGLASPASGLFINRVTDNFTAALEALYQKNDVRTLSSPNLVARENTEASVIVGDRQGYKVTTTINQVTTESVEFLESGVILRVLPTIDELDSELPRAWTVSVAGFEAFDEAFSMEMLLRDGDLQAYVLPNPTQPGPYVVYVGPYLNFERAEEVRTIIDARWGMASQITRFKP